MAKKSRVKGLRNEQAIVNALKEWGLDAERVPLSGAAHGSFGGDIKLEGETYEAKLKSNANGFSLIYRWLENHAGLFLRRDRDQTLVVIRLSRFVELMYDSKQLAEIISSAPE